MEIKENLDKIKEYIKKLNNELSTKNKVLILSAIVAIIVGAIITTAIINRAEYSTLFSNLTSDEVTTIAAKLQSVEIPFKIQDNNILVDKKQESTAMASLATDGYPKSGLAYGVFTDNVNLMTTDYEKKSYMLFDLQNRLASTIRLFDGVSNAVVTIALSESAKYVLQDDIKEPSASVVVIMRNGGSPTAKQVDSIKKLVSKSLPGMSAEQVVILDGNGEEILATDDANQNYSTTTAKLRFELERILESSIKAKVINVIEPIFGAQKVSVSVKSTIDIDKKISELTDYSPEENSGNTGVTSQKGFMYEGQGLTSAPSGVAGTETNSDVPIYTGQNNDDNNNLSRREENYNYLVTQFKEQVQRDGGQTTDLNVSVVIDAAQLAPETIGELKKLVANASGIPIESMDDKISVFAMEFLQNGKDQNGLVSQRWNFEFKPWMYIILGLILVWIAIFTHMVVKNKRLKKEINELEEDFMDGVMAMDAVKNSDQQLQGDFALGAIIQEEVADINVKKIDVDELVRKFVAENPEIAANRIKDWLNGGDADE